MKLAMSGKDWPNMIKPNDPEITCPNCHANYIIRQGMQEQPPLFCTYCGSSLDPAKAQTIVSETAGESTGSPGSSFASITLIPGLQPEEESIQFTLGPYQVLKGIGKGGMGEVFLAYDTTCGRRIALKRIRSDLVEHIQMHNRFLKEARITSQLTHPSIIPIYAIHGQDNLVYYTMPYVEGETLKQILRKTRLMERRGQKSDTGSIPSLVRIFLNICQAIAYAHSKGVLHRDIKPENIIVGQYGEVLILDWGLAKLLRPGKTPAEEEEFTQEHEGHPLHQLTNVGKVVGTVAYMAPERAMGNPATYQSDIYSLGVILYQILTLYMPYKEAPSNNSARRCTWKIYMTLPKWLPIGMFPGYSRALFSNALRQIWTNATIMSRSSSTTSKVISKEGPNGSRSLNLIYSTKPTGNFRKTSSSQSISPSRAERKYPTG